MLHPGCLMGVNWQLQVKRFAFREMQLIVMRQLTKQKQTSNPKILKHP